MPKKLSAIPDHKSLQFRKTLSIPALLTRTQFHFKNVDDPRKKKSLYPLPDVLMSGLAIFGLKCASLLEFDTKIREKRVKHNLNTLYHIKKTPCDSQLRNVLDPVEPKQLRKPTVSIIQELQRQGLLKAYHFLDHLLVTLDGTGQFSSNTLSCPHCCEKKRQNGTVEYYHQLLVASIVHPNKKTVLPLFNEPIKKEDGKTKNDCELNAAKRLLPELKKAFPRLKIIILADALFANAPFIKLIKDQGFKFVIRVKFGNNKTLEKTLQTQFEQGSMDEFEIRDQSEKKKEVLRGYRFINKIPLNKGNPNCLINYLDYWEVDKKDKEKNFLWISDLTLSRENVYKIMRAGRARWKIENEVFNTLKNLGYHFEHNYGHGKQNLSSVFGTLMLLAFLLDQVQEYCCTLFKAAKNRFYSKKTFWEKLRSTFFEYEIEKWEDLYFSIIYDHKGEKLHPNYP